MAEERGALMDDRQLNEEDKYGAVVRKPGSYVPPSLRQKETPVATSAKDMKHATTDGKKIGALESQTINAPIGSLTPKGAEGKVEIEKKAPIGDKNRLSLNPNAPSFSFNIGASEFQPVGLHWCIINNSFRLLGHLLLLLNLVYPFLFTWLLLATDFVVYC